jgi:hypothetical protein
MNQMTIHQLHTFVENNTLFATLAPSERKKAIATNVARLIDVVSTVNTDEIYTVAYEDVQGNFSSTTVEIMNGSVL